MKCKFCKKPCIKKGKVKNVQRFQCTCCKKYQQAAYSKPRIPQEKYEWTIKLNNEGCGISNIARLIEISKSSVQRLIERIVANLKMPEINEHGQSYEIDELRTLLKRLARKTRCFTRSAEMLENAVFLLVFRQKIVWVD